jgi:hypothetical protein
MSNVVGYDKVMTYVKEIGLKKWPRLNYIRIDCKDLFFDDGEYFQPVTVAERSEACSVFARSEAGIVGSNPTQSMDVWYVYVFIPSCV